MGAIATAQREAYRAAIPENLRNSLDAIAAGGQRQSDDKTSNIDDDIVFHCAGLDHSDTDNAERLRLHFGSDLIVVAQEKAKEPFFAVWTGTHWDVQHGGQRAHAIAQKLGGRIALEARHLKPTEQEEAVIAAAADAYRRKDAERNAEERSLVAAAEKAKDAHAKRIKRRMDHAVSSKNSARLVAMLKCLAPHIMRNPDDFNADDYKFACENATIKFRRTFQKVRNVEYISDDATPDLPPYSDICSAAKIVVDGGHSRTDLITHILPVQYDPKAKCPEWLRFLTYTQPREDVRKLIQVSSGLTLLGITPQKLFFHYGNGANGKSVYMEVLCRLLGETAVTLPATSFIGEGGSSGGASPDIARLYGRRMLRVKELPEGEDLKEALIKDVTGGETVTARDLFSGYMDFKPHFTAMMSGNGYPTITGTDNGIWRRMCVIPWLVTIPEDRQRDFEEMVESFRLEFAGILNWMVEGVRIYLTEGLTIPDSVQDATQEYRDDMDRTAGFVTRWLIRDDTAPPLQANALYKAYCRDTEQQGGKPMNPTAFGRAMKKKFRKDSTGRVVLYFGILIRPGLYDDQEPPGRDYSERFPPPSEEPWPSDLTP